MCRADRLLLKNILFSIILLLISILFHSKLGKAQELRLLEADKISMDSYRVWHNYDAYFNGLYGGQAGDPEYEDFLWGVTMHANLTFIEYKKFKWQFNNDIDGISTQDAFRSVEWRFRNEISLYDKVGVFWQHMSRHSLDEAPVTPQMYPLSDKFGVELVFFQR